MTTDTPTPEADLRETDLPETDLRGAAITRLRKKREFFQHVVVYVVVNLALNLIWLFTMPGGFYWPMFPMILWGIGVVFHAMDTFGPTAPTEDKIRREMGRLARR